MIEETLVAALTANAGVAAQISTRFFPVGGRQGTALPYATWLRVSTQGAPSLNDASRLDWPRFQIDCYGATALAALTAAAAIRTALDAATLTASGISFSATFQDQRGPEKDPDTTNWRVGQDYFIFHERT